MKRDEKQYQREHFRTHATDITVAACEEFFEWVCHFTDDLNVECEWRSGSLYEYFDAWVAQKKKSLSRAGTAVADADGATWDGFSQLVPYIYIGIIDQLIVNPTRLDYVLYTPSGEKSLTIPRPMRRVLFVGGKEFDQDIDVVLDWLRPADEDVTSWGYAGTYPDPPPSPSDPHTNE